jgi:hypothetical protein
MTEERLLRIRALYKSLERINNRVESMIRSENFVSDSVRGGAATDAGRGHVISISGKGHAGLPKKLAELETIAAKYNKECIEVEDWYNALPESTSDALTIKGIIYDYYFAGNTMKETGAAWGYSAGGISAKLIKYWRSQNC